MIAYAACGGLLAITFAGLSEAVEAPAVSDRQTPSSTIARLSGVHRSRGVVVKMSALFGLDAFGGGFVVQSFAAYWFYLRFGVDPVLLGTLFFWTNILAGISALLAARLASRFGLIRWPSWFCCCASASARDGRADSAVLPDGRRGSGRAGSRAPR